MAYLPQQCDMKKTDSLPSLLPAHPHGEEHIVLCTTVCETLVWGFCLCACERALEDRSKQVQVFEELPGSYPIMSPARRGMLGVEECTDVLSESVFVLSP